MESRSVSGYSSPLKLLCQAPQEQPRVRLRELHRYSLTFDQPFRVIHNAAIASTFTHSLLRFYAAFVTPTIKVQVHPIDIPLFFSCLRKVHLRI